MIEGLFKYEDDPLKHYVRTEAWLPLCRKRLRTIRNASPPGAPKRRLRYFTFCAVGAVDVLMLDVARVIRPSAQGFDTVCFFDKTPELVAETHKRIPGAFGFPGDFTEVVVCDDPDDEYVIGGGDPLAPPVADQDTLETRSRKVLLAQRQEFIRQFPFDVINLDLEEFLFKPKDPFPGKIVKALRNLFSWQRRPLTTPQVRNQKLDGFTLMFTTQIGPPNLSDEYLNMLRDRLNMNISDDVHLSSLLTERTGLDNIEALRQEQFNDFFKLGMPKILASILMEEDWYIDSEVGILMYEFERPSKTGPYQMLHLAMDVKRHNPPKERRAPGISSSEAQAAYQEVIRQIFSKRETIVSPESINQASLQEDLNRIKARRRKYYPDEEAMPLSH
jgi:hypothetical protein